VAINGLTDNLAEISGEGEIASLVKLIFRKAGPLTVNLAALNRASHDKHDVGVTVIGAATIIAANFVCNFMRYPTKDLPGLGV